ncbi:MAG TPA: arylamine N-acetyltransferase [Candidatus Yaniella excrementigallinarum]|nr:arylamine N-acetyltransferase [Candidatus Yaniella excrementigallinarum]
MSTDNSLTGTLWHTADFDTDRHLKLLGLGFDQPSYELLVQLHTRHVHTFPFCAVDVLLDDHPGVEPATVSRRILVEGQGGYCFEHAQLFAATCQALGFEVHRHLGRVHDATNTRTHMSVEVVLDGIRYLTDPGFGLSITGPIELADGASRIESHGTYTMHRLELGGIEHWQLRRDDEIAHISDTLPVMPIDVRTGHTVTSTHSATGSLFTRTLIASRFTDAGHMSLADTTLTIRQAEKPTEQHQLTPAQAVDTVRELGVQLDEEKADKLRKLLN